MRSSMVFSAASPEWPGERNAIITVCDLGEVYGFGNLIWRLLGEWSARLEDEYGLPPGNQMDWASQEIAERAARQDKVIAVLREELARAREDLAQKGDG